ncbi:rhodanese-like domain-containing protein [bacterium]|nr:rhodanese-like domain-containing protein [bacterium]
MQKLRFTSLLIGLLSLPALAQNDKPTNPLIDYDGFHKDVAEVNAFRDSKRMSEPEFLEAMNSGEYILLDARSARFYQMRHVKGAVNLPFTEFTASTLAEVIPKKNTPILIYCNNNFLNDPVAMVSKAPSSSLNLSTQVSLYSYGYSEVYELAPLIDIDDTPLPFEGTEVVAAMPDQ